VVRASVTASQRGSLRILSHADEKVGAAVREGRAASNAAKPTVPIGGGVAKTMRLGEQPVKLAVDAYYNAIRPEANHETWLLKTTLTFQFPD